MCANPRLCPTALPRIKYRHTSTYPPTPNAAMTVCTSAPVHAVAVAWQEGCDARGVGGQGGGEGSRAVSKSVDVGSRGMDLLSRGKAVQVDIMLTLG